MTQAKHRTPCRYIIAQFTHDQIVSACAMEVDGWTARFPIPDGTRELVIRGKVVAVHEEDLVEVRKVNNGRSGPTPDLVILDEITFTDPHGFAYETDLLSSIEPVYYGD